MFKGEVTQFGVSSFHLTRNKLAFGIYIRVYITRHLISGRSEKVSRIIISIILLLSSARTIINIMTREPEIVQLKTLVISNLSLICKLVEDNAFNV